MKIRNVIVSTKSAAKAALVTLGALAVPAFAQSSSTGDLSSLSGVLTGLDTTDVITAMVGAAALLAGVGFAKWASKKVGKFFG